MLFQPIRAYNTSTDRLFRLFVIVTIVYKDIAQTFFKCIIGSFSDKTSNFADKLRKFDINQENNHHAGKIRNTDRNKKCN